MSKRRRRKPKRTPAEPKAVTPNILKQRSQIIRLLTESLGGEVPSSFDLENFQTALQKSVWLFTCTYTLAFALANIGFRVISKSTKEERDDPTAQKLRRLLQRVNPEDTYGDWIEQNLVHLPLAGESYNEIVRGPLGTPNQLWCWNPTDVFPVPDETGKRRVRGYLFRRGGGEKFLKAEDVIPIRVYNPSNPLRGMAATAPMNTDLQADTAASAHNRSLLKRGGRIGGILKPTDGDLGNDAWRQLMESLRVQHSGPDNSGKHMVLPSGVDFSEGTFSLKDMDFLGLRRFARETAAGVVGVAPMMVGNFDSASYANAEQQLKGFWDYRGKPWLNKIFGAVNEFLAPQFGDDDLAVTADLAQIDAMVDNLSATVQNNSTLVQGGVITVNEARRDLGRPPVPDGDTLLVPLNLVPADPAQIKPKEEPATGDDTAPATAPKGEEPPEAEQSTTLRVGAINAALAIVNQVAAGTIPRDSGLGMLAELVGLTPEQIEAVMGSAGLPDVPTTPNPKGEAEAETEEGEGDNQDPPPPGDDDQVDDDEGNEPPTDEDDEDAKAAKAHDRDASREAHDVQLARAEAKLAGKVREYLLAAKARYIARVKAQGTVPDVDSILGNREMEAREAMVVLAPAILETVQDAGELTLSRLGMGKVAGTRWQAKAESPDRLPLEIIDLVEAFDLANPRVLGYLESHFLDHLEDLSGRTLTDLETTLNESLAAGEGISEMVVRVDKLGAFTEDRAERIARTETIGAFNLGAQESFRVVGTPRKSWLSTPDERRRRSHGDIDSETRAAPILATDRFELKDPKRGRAFLMFPGDPETNQAWAVVHCRCSMLPEDDVALAYWAEHCRKELADAALVTT